MPTADHARRESAHAIVPWDIPDLVKIDLDRQRVTAYMRMVDRQQARPGGPVLTDLLKVAKAPAGEPVGDAVKAFVQRYGLLDSPLEDGRLAGQEDDHFVYTESIASYSEMAQLLSSTLRVHSAIARRTSIDPDDVGRLIHFFDHPERNGYERIVIAKAAVPVSAVKVIDEVIQPLPMRFTGRDGDVPGAWRRVQAQRALEVFNLLVRLGSVRPLLMGGEQAPSLVWTGGAWGAVLGALHASLASPTRLGVCGICGAPYGANVKAPRRSYKGKPVSLCCADSECRREKQRRDTAASRHRMQNNR